VDSVKNWIDIIEIIRNKKINIPLVIMSSYNDLNRLSLAFDSWANDYIIKPFRLKELELRILKWFKTYLVNLKLNIDDNHLIYWELKYSIINNEFYFNTSIIKLTRRNKYLLFIFIWNNEKLLTERFLINKIYWDLDLFNNRNIRVDILRLKKSLESIWINTWIKNIRWEGYILKKN
jgi:DNA-binding response OmpR family regulator